MDSSKLIAIEIIPIGIDSENPTRFDIIGYVPLKPRFLCHTKTYTQALVWKESIESAIFAAYKLGKEDGTNEKQNMHY